MSNKEHFIQQAHHKHVWVAKFDVNYYKIVASIQSERFNFLKEGKIYEYGEETNDENILKIKKGYSSLVHDLGKSNRFFCQSKITPDALWIENDNVKTPNELDYVFDIMYGGIIFNQTLTNILTQHRLGENILTPVQIYDLSTGDLVSDEIFYFLNLYERRNYICYPQSDSTFVYIQGAKRYSTRGAPIEDNMLEVDKSILDCDIDLWHDDRLGEHFFMSDSLYQSLKQANMIDKFSPCLCKLI